MTKTAAMVFGVVLLLIGILGFIPGVTNTDGLLLGIFQVDTVHNIVHLITGALGIYAATASLSTSRMYFQVFGVVYALIAILGFFSGDGMVLGFLVNNMADTWLHVVIAVVALYYGFGTNEQAA